MEVIIFKNRLLQIFLIAQVLLLTGMGVLPNQKPEKCALCGRDVHEITKTLVTFEEGKDEKACCIKCALKYEAESSKKALAIRVPDFNTGETIEAEKAFYVVGSDITPCCSQKVMIDQAKMPFVLCYDRCLPSVIAFKTKEEAIKFMKEHGGRISIFNELENFEK
ncbi:MAG: hypothetical protein A2042_09155 [Candidatus Schekmanbacteria bacterium GWA2_38_11]|uniref:Uncharacterized protein n=1 Tax=Candidatus Schekmanbacteria bacterium GWA2_38_11 TaxID=1817876 RepID=A0A1F7RLL6_9BACT|nr:MAG: hypothetical protein A2042_09155 [Candidatus Schekmanbacteria bacterium GWA2_38_11]